MDVATLHNYLLISISICALSAEGKIVTKVLKTHKLHKDRRKILIMILFCKGTAVNAIKKLHNWVSCFARNSSLKKKSSDNLKCQNKLKRKYFQRQSALEDKGAFKT